MEHVWGCAEMVGVVAPKDSGHRKDCDEWAEYSWIGLVSQVFSEAYCRHEESLKRIRHKGLLSEGTRNDVEVMSVRAIEQKAMFSLNFKK